MSSPSPRNSRSARTSSERHLNSAGALWQSRRNPAIALAAPELSHTTHALFLFSILNFLFPNFQFHRLTPAPNLPYTTVLTSAEKARAHARVRRLHNATRHHAQHPPGVPRRR